MRTRITLALALCAAAAPLHAQKAGNVHHGTGYEMVLPARYHFISTSNTTKDGQPLNTSLFGNDDGMVMVVRARFSQEMNDTTLTTRRAILQLARVGMMEAGGEMRFEGDPVEIVHDDRITLRTPVVITDDGETVRGTADVSVSRRGQPTLWMLMALRRHPGPRDSEIAAVALDSFRLTGDDDEVMPPAEMAARDELAAKP